MKPVTLATPDWFRRLLPAEIELSATIVGAGRIRLGLRFPRGLLVTAEVQPREGGQRGPGFAVASLNEGRGFQEQKARACLLLEKRLLLDEARVLSWMQHATRLWLLANDSDDDSLCPDEPPLRSAWSALRALHRIRAAGGAEALSLLESSALAEADASALPIVVHLRFALGELISAMALLDASAGDEESTVGLLNRGILAGLVGDPDHVRAVCARLSDRARQGRTGVNFDLLLTSGLLAQLSRDAETAWGYLGEVAHGRGRPSDVMAALRVLLELNRQDAFVKMARSLVDEMRGSSLGVRGLGLLCETAGDYELAADAYRLSIRPEEPSGLAPETVEARLALARLAVWRLDILEARQHLEALGAKTGSIEAARLRATIEVIEGRPAKAIEIFEDLEKRSPQSSGGAEHQLWRAEALLALGRLDEAFEAGIRSHEIANSFAARVIKERIFVTRCLEGERAPREGRPSRLELEVGREGSFRTVTELWEMLDGEITREESEAAKADPRMRLRILEKATRQMGGNRAPHPTRLIVGADRSVRMTSWELPHHARQASLSLFECLRLEDPAAVLRKFDLLTERFSDSPFPFTYRGELRLWLGDYSGALADFDEAIRREPTRWAYIGMGAASMFLGDPHRANLLFDEGIARFGELATATTHVYRGELRRKLGDIEGAKADLELAVEQRPSRVAARLNLALTYAEMNRPIESGRELERALRQVPGFLFLGAKSLGREVPAVLDTEAVKPVIEHALVLMQGNRSSWLYSIVDKAGRFRLLPTGEMWTDVARRSLWLSEQALLRELDIGSTRAL